MIEECLSRYGPEEVCVSFNGGKDCSALLHLVYASWKKKRTSSDQRLRALYIRSSDPFPEMEQFVQDTRQRHLSYSYSSSCPFFFLPLIATPPPPTLFYWTPLFPLHFLPVVPPPDSNRSFQVPRDIVGGGGAVKIFPSICTHPPGHPSPPVRMSSLSAHI